MIETPPPPDQEPVPEKKSVQDFLSDLEASLKNQSTGKVKTDNSNFGRLSQLAEKVYYLGTKTDDDRPGWSEPSRAAYMLNHVVLVGNKRKTPHRLSFDVFETGGKTLLEQALRWLAKHRNQLAFTYRVSKSTDGLDIAFFPFDLLRENNEPDKTSLLNTTIEPKIIDGTRHIVCPQGSWVGSNVSSDRIVSIGRNPKACRYYVLHDSKKTSPQQHI